MTPTEDCHTSFLVSQFLLLLYTTTTTCLAPMGLLLSLSWCLCELAAFLLPQHFPQLFPQLGLLPGMQCGLQIWFFIPDTQLLVLCPVLEACLASALLKLFVSVVWELTRSIPPIPLTETPPVPRGPIRKKAEASASYSLEGLTRGPSPDPPYLLLFWQTLCQRGVGLPPWSYCHFLWLGWGLY